MTGCECGDDREPLVVCGKCGQWCPDRTAAPTGWESEAKAAGDLGADEAWERFYRAQERERALRRVCQAVADELGVSHAPARGVMKALSVAAAGADPTPYLDGEDTG